MNDLMEKALNVAMDAARESARSIRGYYRGEFNIEIKADQTPVTVADRAAEDIIRRIVLAAFPDHGFYGEEGGASQQDADYLWLVDPIDGTKSFIAGYGMFSTQIALMHRGELVLGVSSAPAHGEIAWGVRGAGSSLRRGEENEQNLGVSSIGTIEKAAISTGNIQSLARSRRWPVLGQILGKANRTRGYGDYYHYHRLAQGQIDAVIESDVNILDIAALAVVVAEAGGVFTDLEGRPPDLQTRSVLAANAALHHELLQRLNPSGGDSDAGDDRTESSAAGNA